MIIALLVLAKRTVVFDENHLAEAGQTVLGVLFECEALTGKIVASGLGACLFCCQFVINGMLYFFRSYIASSYFVTYRINCFAKVINGLYNVSKFSGIHANTFYGAFALFFIAYPPGTL